MAPTAHAYLLLFGGERAYRRADGREYPHGHRLDTGQANFDATYGKVPRAMGPDEVGSHTASRSPFGLHDMAGNNGVSLNGSL